MKFSKVLLLISIAIFTILSNTYSQKNDSLVIRDLEEAERTAILKGDTVRLSEIMSSRIIVNNPENNIVGYQGIINRIKSGKINYISFERNIERISIINGMAVVMGQEIVVPYSSGAAGKAVHRRFTNVWTKENGTWKLTARQATLITPK